MLLVHGKIYTAEPSVGVIEDGYILVQDGKIKQVGPMAQLGAYAKPEALDLGGKCCYPGFIDAHTHLGMWEDALGFEGDDGNEDTDPSSPHLRALDAVNPMDKCFSEAAKAGITTVVTGPGSANPVGGQMLAMKTVGRRIDDMVISEPVGYKFALGENPKTTYHEKSQTPVTRMATAAIIREQLYKTFKYNEKMTQYESDESEDEPDYDMKCEALIPLLKREVAAHFHAHRADDICTAMRLAKEFQLKYTLVHCTDGAKIADILAAEGATALCGPLLCDRSKPELSALSPKLAARLCSAGVKIGIITDHPVIPIQYLPLCAGLAVREGMRFEDALSAITLWPAEICGIAHRVGSIAPGKDADIVIFSQDPFSTYAKPDAVMINGVMQA